MKPHPHASIYSTRRTFVGQLALGAMTLALASRTRAAADAQPAGGKKLGVALIGLGTYSRTQLGPALRQTRNCQLTGVVTGDHAKGERWAREYGFPARNIYDYATIPQIAENPDIDILYVVTPNSLHAEHVAAAAKAGKHVICEKPMAVSVAECDAMIAACRAAKVKLSIGYRLHFDPYHQELMRHAREKDFGAFTRMNGNFSFVMGGRPWRAIRKYSGGGPIMDIGIYVIHEATLAANGAAPIAVTAKEGPKTRPEIFQDVEEAMAWTMEFADGATCEGGTSYTRNENRFRAEAPRGWMEIDNAFSYSGLRAATNRGPLRFEPPVNQQARQMDDFAQCVREGRESSVAGELGRRDMAIIEAIYEAARTGKRVEVKA
jgi:glucose-fructose oxidoreductase